jgi:hypothetical protein
MSESALNFAVGATSALNMVVKTNVLVLSHQLVDSFFIKRNVTKQIRNDIPELDLFDLRFLICHVKYLPFHN